MKNILHILYLTIFFLLFTSCELLSIRHQLHSFMKHNITIPNEMYVFDGNNKLFYKDTTRVPTLVIYHDSTSCFECVISHLDNYEWLFNKSKKEQKFKIIIIFSPPREQYDQIKRQLIIREYMHPILFDYNEVFATLNYFIPNDKRFHSFVIDYDGRILFVGDPSENEKLELLFNKVVSDYGK